MADTTAHFLINNIIWRRQQQKNIYIKTVFQNYQQGPALMLSVSTGVNLLKHNNHESKQAPFG